MATELELKARIPDPAALPRALERAGVGPGVSGMLRDRRHALAVFTGEYRDRTGRAPLLDEDALGGTLADWSRR